MMYQDSEKRKTLEDLLSTSTETNMLRLKVTLLSLTRLPIEYKIIGLLCDGYQEMDIAGALKISRQRVNLVIHNFRKRLTTEQVMDVFSIIKED